MNITIQQKKLLGALRATEKIVSRNVALPILNTILLRTEGGRLNLTTTNLEMGMHYWIGAKIETEGVLAVPARIFSEFISSVVDEKITLTSKNEVLTITAEHTTTQILCMKPDEFPIVPTVKAAKELKIPSKQLSVALSGVVEATSLLETRPELSGVYMRTEGKTVAFAATDSFRLAERVLPLQNSEDISAIIPRTTAQEILRLAAERDEEITVAISDNQLAVRGSDVELISRLIDGRYPDYKKVIPEKFTATVVVEKGEFERTVRMASIFSSSVADLQLKAQGTTLQLTAKNSDKGEINTQISVASVKTPFEIAINYRYLLDGLKAVPSDRVVIGFTGPGSPLVLSAENQKDYVYVIMPLRTS